MGGEENDQQQVCRGLEVVGDQPAWRGGRVPGQAEGVGDGLQPHHLQILPARWSTRGTMPNGMPSGMPNGIPNGMAGGIRKDQPALDQTLVQQLKKSTRSMLLYFSSLLRNSISVIEHKHVIHLPKYFDRNIY